MDTLDFLSSPQHDNAAAFTAPHHLHQEPLSASEFAFFEPTSCMQEFNQEFENNDEFSDMEDDELTEDDFIMTASTDGEEDDEDDNDQLIKLNKIDILNYQNSAKPSWDHFRIQNPFLHLPHNMDNSAADTTFGLIYEDSYNSSRALVPFHHNSIVAIMRQMDTDSNTGAASAYIVFNRFLTTRDYGVLDFHSDVDSVDNDSQHRLSPTSHSSASTQKFNDWLQKQESQQQQYSYDANSPLRHCIALILHFSHKNGIYQLFDYVKENIPALRVVQPDWMFAHEKLTNQEVQLLPMKYNVQSSSASAGAAVDVFDWECKSNAYLERERDSNSTTSVAVRKRVTKNIPAGPVKPVAAAPKKQSEEPILVSSTTPKKQSRRRGKRTRRVSSRNHLKSRSYKQDSVSLLDKNLALLLLPQAFARSHKSIQSIIVQYLRQDRISFFQLTNSLCEVLSSAESEAAVRNAIIIVKTLAEHPNVQLKNTEAVHSFIHSADSKKAAPRKEESTQLDSKKLEEEHNHQTEQTVAPSGSSEPVLDTPQQESKEEEAKDATPADVEISITSNDEPSPAPQSSSSHDVTTKAESSQKKVSFPNLVSEEKSASFVPEYNESVYKNHYPKLENMELAESASKEERTSSEGEKPSTSTSTSIYPSALLNNGTVQNSQQQQGEGAPVQHHVVYHHHYHYMVPPPMQNNGNPFGNGSTTSMVSYGASQSSIGGHHCHDSEGVRKMRRKRRSRRPRWWKRFLCMPFLA